MEKGKEYQEITKVTHWRNWGLSSFIQLGWQMAFFCFLWQFIFVKEQSNAKINLLHIYVINTPYNKFISGTLVLLPSR